MQLCAQRKHSGNQADANIALGAYNAAVVNKMGGLAARLTYGATKEAAVEHFQAAMKFNSSSAVAHIEYANGLAMLFGKAKLVEATKLYEEAARCEPADVMEWLDVELAKSELLLKSMALVRQTGFPSQFHIWEPPRPARREVHWRCACR
jgi:hypothetical protein